MTLTISLDNIVTINHTHLTVVLTEIIARLNTHHQRHDDHTAVSNAVHEAQAAQIAALQMQVGALTDKLEQSRDQQNSDAITELQATIQLQSDAIGTHTTALHQVNGQLDGLGGLTGEQVKLAGQVGELEQQVVDLTAQLSAMTTELASTKSHLTSNTAKSQPHVTAAAAVVAPTVPQPQQVVVQQQAVDRSESDRRINELTHAVAAQSKNVDDLNNTVEIQQSLIQQLQSQLSQLQARAPTPTPAPAPAAAPTHHTAVQQPPHYVDTGLEQRMLTAEAKLNTNEIQTKVILNKLHLCTDNVKQHDVKLTDLDERLQLLMNQAAAAAAADAERRRLQQQMVVVQPTASVDKVLTERVTTVESLVDTLNTKLTALTAAPPRTALTVSSTVLDKFSGADGDKLKQYLSDQFAIIYAHEAKYTSDIADLYAKLTTVKQSISGVTTQSFDTAQLVSDLLHRFEALQHDVNKRLQHIVSKQYVDKQNDDVRQLQHQHEKVIDKQLKTELKRFENDLMALLSNQTMSAQHGGGNTTAIGSMRFKCISCDQPTASISGPATLQFSRSVNGANVPITGDRATTQLLIDKSNSVYAYSDRDDKFYKSRLATPQLYLKPADIDSPKGQHFDVKYLNEPSSVTQNAYGVNGSVAYADVENLPPVNQRPVSAANYQPTVTGKTELTRPFTSAGLLPKTLKKK